MGKTLKIKESIKQPIGSVCIELFDAKTGKLKSRDIVHNMFVTSGKDSIAACLSGENARGIITYAALGTGSTAPALDDLTLESEIQRKLISVRSVENNIATFQTFFTTAEGNGSLKEAGLFGDDATATTDSGTLFARTAINRTKTSNDTMILSWTIEIA